MPRLKPLVFEELTPEQQQVYKILGSTRGGIVSGPFIPRIQFPALCLDLQKVNDRIRLHTSFEKADFELIVLLVARRFSSNYVWGVHAVHAAEAGVPQEIIQSINEEQSPSLSSPISSLIFQLANVLTLRQVVPSSLYDQALSVLGMQRLTEIATIVGFYSMAAVTVNTYDIPAKEGTPSLSLLDKPEKERFGGTQPAPTESRIAPLVYEDLSEEQKRLYRDIGRTRNGHVGGAFSVWIRDPELCRPLLAVSDRLRTESLLDPPIKEILDLVTARRFHTALFWGTHVRDAQNVGISLEDIQAINEGKMPSFGEESHCLTYQTAQHLLDGGVLKKEIYEKALALWGQDRLTEIATDIGFSVMLCTLINCFALPAKPGAYPLK